jgi:hypothetical protein
LKQEQEISEQLYLGWRIRGSILCQNINGRLEDVVRFEDIKEGCYYFLRHHKTNFEGFAAIEAKIQTIDVSESVINGNVGDDLLAFKNGEAKYEYEIYAPETIIQQSDLNFNFPIKPDSIVFNSVGGLYIESKHQVTHGDVQKTVQKCEFLKNYLLESWFLKEKKKKYPTSFKLQTAMCSIAPIPLNFVSEFPTVSFLVRKGLKYVKL